MTFLTHEEELALSDALYERSVLRDRLQDEGLDTPETEEDIETWKRGLEAANRLVEAYLPKARALAHGVLSKRPIMTRDGVVTFDDLVQVGVEAMINCCWKFDARGQSRHDENGRLGVRFSTYSRLRVQKEMNRFVAKTSTPFSLNVDTIQETWTWIAARSELEANLGRQPTDEEVAEATGIHKESWVEDGLPSSAGTLDVTDHEVRRADSLEEKVQVALDSQMYNGILESMLLQYFHGDIVRMFMAFIGADNGVPRTAAEVAKMFGVTRAEAAQKEQIIYSAIRHPQNRKSMVEHLNRVLDH